MNNDFLNALRKEPRPPFAEALYRRISSATSSQLHHNAWRFSATIGALVAVLAGVLLLSPSARAFAEGIVRRVGGYAFALGSQSVNLRGGDSPIQIDKTLGVVSIQTIGKVPSVNDPEEASRMTGFTVLAPSYLPAGFSAMSDWYISSEDGGMVATKGYRDATKQHFLAVNQWAAPDGARREYARDVIVEVNVRGQAGVWLPAGIPAGKSALVWTENGITYWMITDWLPLDEMLRVADSLAR